MDTRYPTPMHSPAPPSSVPRKRDVFFADSPDVHPRALPPLLSAPQLAAGPTPRYEAEHLIQLRYEAYLARSAVEVMFENGELECLGR